MAPPTSTSTSTTSATICSRRTVAAPSRYNVPVTQSHQPGTTHHGTSLLVLGIPTPGYPGYHTTILTT
eukprot:2648768-Rhodomonas_salina.1